MLVLQSSTADLAALEWASGHLGCSQLGYWVVNHLVVFGRQSGLQQVINGMLWDFAPRWSTKLGQPSLHAGWEWQDSIGLQYVQLC
jgi:hypothetical protein